MCKTNGSVEALPVGKIFIILCDITVEDITVGAGELISRQGVVGKKSRWFALPK